MAGGNWHPVRLDPKIERWAHMREHVYEHFKFTPKATRIVLIWAVLVPTGVYYWNRSQTLKWDLTGKLAGQSLLAKPPSAVEEAAGSPEKL